ncbi:MAG: C-GCAxxG-C-C family protein [Bacteroidota bacterium]
MTRSEEASKWFADGYNCSQSVLTSFGREYGLTDEQCLKLGCAFGGGIARRQLTCGVVTGALMVIGLHFGRGAGAPYSTTTGTYERANRFIAEFTKRNGSINCKELLQGLDMTVPADMAKIQSLGLFQNNCARYVKDAVELTEWILAQKTTV